MQHHSPLDSCSQYFPPTPPLSDTEAIDKPEDMANLVPHTAGQKTGGNPGTSGAPTKVTLSLGNLPSKKDFKAPWPRTPSKVRCCLRRAPHPAHIPVFDFRLTLTTRHGPLIVDTTSTHSLMRQWAFVFPPSSEKLSKIRLAP